MKIVSNRKNTYEYAYQYQASLYSTLLFNSFFLYDTAKVRQMLWKSLIPGSMPE